MPPHTPSARTARRHARRRWRVALPPVLACTAGLWAAVTVVGAPAPIMISAPAVTPRPGAVLPISATDPAGWFCRISAASATRHDVITPVVGTPHGAITTGWLVPRNAAPGRWTLTVACAPTAAGVSAARASAASLTITIRPDVPPAEVRPALVDITSDLGYDSGESAAGTGVVIASSGLVLTNNHVIIGGTAIRATDLGNGRTYAVRVVGVDISHDLAVIRLVDADGVRRAPFGNSGALVRGSAVSTLGNVGGGGGAVITSGIVTALNQRIVADDSAANLSEHLSGLLETDALLRPGDSGGPLVDASGAVVGIDTAAAVSTVDESTQNEGYAIPFASAISTARSIIAGTPSTDLRLGDAAYTAYLGIQVVAVPDGIKIVQILPGSPAAKTLAPYAGDIIRTVDTDPDASPPVPAHAVSTPAQLQEIIDALEPGDEIALRLSGSGAPVHPVTVTLGVGAAR